MFIYKHALFDLFFNLEVFRRQRNELKTTIIHSWRSHETWERIRFTIHSYTHTGRGLTQHFTQQVILAEGGNQYVGINDLTITHCVLTFESKQSMIASSVFKFIFNCLESLSQVFLIAWLMCDASLNINK